MDVAGMLCESMLRGSDEQIVKPLAQKTAIMIRLTKTNQRNVGWIDNRFIRRVFLISVMARAGGEFEIFKTA